MFDYEFKFIMFYRIITMYSSRSYKIYSIYDFIRILKIKKSEFLKIIEEFNGKNIYSITLKWSNCIRFNNEEDCKNCINYLNGLLIMNKLIDQFTKL